MVETIVGPDLPEGVDIFTPFTGIVELPDGSILVKTTTTSEKPDAEREIADFEPMRDAIRDFMASRYMRGIPREEILSSVVNVLAPRFAEPLTEDELRSRFDRAWKGTPGRALPRLRPRPCAGRPDAVGRRGPADRRRRARRRRTG